MATASGVDYGKTLFIVTWNLICPVTYQPLVLVDTNTLATADKRQRYQRIDGIWRFLLDDQDATIDALKQEQAVVQGGKKLRNYERDDFLALPYVSAADKNSAEWRIRSRSFETFINSVMPKLLNASKILDMGAGNGWLAGRLAKMGHHVAAVDLRIDAFDGLGAHVHYQPPITPLQAAFERLPIASSTVDLIVFNAALHYSTDLNRTLSEALRVAKSQALIAIIDTPVYYHKASGQNMVAAREADFFAAHGVSSSLELRENYLTYRRLQKLEKALKIKWGFYDPKFPLGWSVRRRIDGLRTGREVAQFPLIIGNRKQAHL